MLLKNDQKRLLETSELPTHTSSILGLFGRTTLWLWLDRGAIRVGTMLAGLLLIRYLGPSDYGLYVTALSVGALGNVVLDLGLTRYAARALATNPREGSTVLALSLFVTAASLTLEILSLILAVAWGNWLLASVCAGLVITNLEGTASLCSSVLIADLRPRAVLPGSFLNMIGLIAVITVTVWQHLSVFLLLAGISLKSLLLAGMRLWQVQTHWPTRGDWHWKTFRWVAGRAWPFFSHSLTQIGYEKFSIACFALVATRQEVGWFSAALVIAGVFPQWTFASADALLPLMTRLFEARRIDQLLELRQRLLDVLLLLSIPVVVFLAVFAPEICKILGARFAFSAPVLRIVAYRSLLSVVEGLLGGAFLTATNCVKEKRNALAKALIVLCVLTLLLGHLWGPVGAALALFVADTLIILQYFLIFSRIGLPMSWPAFWPSIVSGTAMLFMAFQLRDTTGWAFKPVSAVLVYFSVLAVIAPSRLLNAGRTMRQCVTGV